MSDLTDSDLKTNVEWTEGVLIKTVRLFINVVTNMLLSVSVFASVLYCWGAEKITTFHLHIILCVLGYQVLMCEGTLVLSVYNSWSIYVPRPLRRRLHAGAQLAGFALAAGGSGVIMADEVRHFSTVHGCLGILALIFATISVINGLAANYAYKFSKNVIIIKFLHYTSGVVTLLLSTGALTTGFAIAPFRHWVKDERAIMGLIFITWVFTLLVAIDFWLRTGQRLRRMCVNNFK